MESVPWRKSQKHKNNIEKETKIMEQKLTLGEGYQINRVINGCWQLSEGHSLKNDLDFSDVMRAFHMLAERGFTTFDCGDIYT